MSPIACPRTCIYLCLAACQAMLLYSIMVVRVGPLSMKKTIHANSHGTSVLGRFSEGLVSKTKHMKVKERACKPVNKFGFLKTHKCGSTTIQNMLLRYVIKHDLKLIVPAEGNFINLSPTWRSWNERPILRPGHNYSVFCLHTIWEHDRIKELIGDHGGEAKYFSIVRDPVDLFISMWDYYDFSSAFKMDLDTFATNTSNAFKMRTDRRVKKQEGHNMMLADFGLPVGSLDNETAVADKIAQIEADFDLVMVMEQFDESLVLLRELLCWDWSDITYFKLNSWQDTRRSSLSPEGRARLKTWLWGDYWIYEHFKKRFVSAVRKYGDNMEHDLKMLRSLNQDIKMDCIKGVVKSNELTGIYKMWGQHMVGYRVDELKKKCVNHAIDEISFINYVRNKQNGQ